MRYPERVKNLLPKRTLVLGFIAAGLMAASFARAQSPVTAIFKRGDLVRVKEIAKPRVMKVIGLPDEIVQVDPSGVYANDVAIPGFSKEFLSRNAWPRQIVPFGHYFVIGEERQGEELSEHVGVHPEDTIERAQ